MIEYRRLDELCHINMGQSPDSKSYNEYAEGLPFFQGNADFGVIYPTARVWCSSPTKVVEPGTLLISVRAPIGALNFAKDRSCIGRGLAGITPHHGISTKFIYYALKGKYKELNAKGTGSTFKAIAKNALGETLVKVASKAEQMEIVQTLDKVSGTIEARKQQLQKLDELVKARFVEMFGDECETVLLSEVAEVTGGLTKNSKRNQFPIKLPYLRVANVFYNSIDTSEMLEIGLTTGERDKTLLQYGDLLFVEGNGSPEQIGRVAVWRDNVVPCVHQNHLIKARFVGDKVLPEFAMYYFMTPKGREQIKRKAVSTSGLYTLSVSKVAAFTLPQPLFNQQKAFAAFAAQIDKSKVAVQQALDKTQQLFDSLVQQYFA